MRCKFLQDMYLEYFVISELAGSNLVQTLHIPSQVIFLLNVSFAFVNAETCSVQNRAVFIKPEHILQGLIM